jgi:hypothetical protein
VNFARDSHITREKKNPCGLRWNVTRDGIHLDLMQNPFGFIVGIHLDDYLVSPMQLTRVLLMVSMRITNGFHQTKMDGLLFCLLV